MQKNPVLPEWFTKLIDKFHLNQSWLTINVSDVSQLSELSKDQIAFFMSMVKLMRSDLPESQLADEILSLGPREVEEKVTAIDVVISRPQQVGLQVSTINQQVNLNSTEQVQTKIVHVGVQNNFFSATQFSNMSSTTLKSDGPFRGCFGLPREFENFTGRSEDLLSLSEHSKNIVTGTGGVGKTQLVLYYAHHKLKEYRESQGKTGFRSIIWLIAGTDEGVDNSGFMSEQFCRLGEQLGFNAKQLNTDELVPLVYQRLEKEQGPYLVVFDNAHNLLSIDTYLPPSSVPAIITTRNSHLGDWDPTIFNLISLGVFSESDSLKYIVRILGANYAFLYVEEQAKSLAKALGNFPLALTQALAFIISQRMAIKNYLEEFEQEKKLYLSEPPWQGDPYQKEKNSSNDRYRAVAGQEHNAQKATVWTVIQLSLREITDLNAIQILKVCAFMAPEAPIDIQLLANWTVSTIECRSALTALHRYSLIETMELSDINFVDKTPIRNVLSSGSARIHQLVQEIVRLSDDSATQKLILEKLVACICRYYEIDTYPRENELRHEILYPHILEVIKNLEVLNGSQYFRKQIAMLNFYLGNIYLFLGNHELALRVYLSAEESFKFLGDKKLIAEVLTQLGAAYIRLDKYKDAVLKLEEARRIKEEIYEPNHLELAGTLCRLGVVARYLGDATESIKILQHALAIRLKHLSSDHVEVAATKMSLGNAYMILNEFECAVEYLTQALSIEEQAYGGEHPAVAGTLANLGVAYLHLKRYDESRQILERALKIEERAYGYEHGNTAKTRAHRATVLGIMDHIEEACAEYKISIRVLKQKFGLNNDFAFNTIGFWMRLETKLIVEGDKIPTAIDWLELADNCFYVGLISISLQLADQALDCEFSIEALLLRVKCQSCLCDFQNASDTVSLIQKLGDRRDARIAVSLAEIKKFQLDAALRQAEIIAFQSQHELNDKDTIKMALNLRLLHQYEKALSVLDRVMMNCDDVDLLAPAKFIQAECYYYMQRYGDAQESAETSNQLKEHDKVKELLRKIKVAVFVHSNLDALFAHLANSPPRTMIF
ncbi:MAG: tetratricopeptide repeat protein [Gammaproteobacteria bacterium]|nr:tetratricopeptide repeat protein [Gammaproteobacteria bacterium]